MRCWCCNSLFDMGTGQCPICDFATLVSPPHVCTKNGIIIGDEHGCEPEFAPIEEDYESLSRLDWESTRG